MVAVCFWSYLNTVILDIDSYWGVGIQAKRGIDVTVGFGCTDSSKNDAERQHMVKLKNTKKQVYFF